MKKTLLLGLMLLLIIGLLSGCKAPEETETEPSVTEIPTQAPPTFFIPTAEPTVTPKPMSSVEWPEANATLMSIDPIDKPTPPPLEFGSYRVYSSAKLRVSFEIPEYFGEPQGEDDINTTGIVFMEPQTNIKSGLYPASVTIAAQTMATVQTMTDAENMLDSIISEIRNEHDSLSTSSKANNKLLGTQGSYVTYWIDQPLSDEENAPTVKMRGRCLVVPVDKKLYTVRYLCPADFNGDYENIYKKIRDTFTEL